MFGEGTLLEYFNITLVFRDFSGETKEYAKKYRFSNETTPA
jgi:hypothetical protein